MLFDSFNRQPALAQLLSQPVPGTQWMWGRSSQEAWKVPDAGSAIKETEPLKGSRGEANGVRAGRLHAAHMCPSDCQRLATGEGDRG